MSSNTTRILALIGVAMAAAFVAAIGILVFGGGNGTASQAEYRAKVQNARDRVDYVFARAGHASSIDDLADRLDEASAVVGSAANELDGAAVAPGYSALNDQLVTSLRGFSDELAGTAAQFRDPSFQGTLAGINSLGFTTWDKVNEVLLQMRKKGLKVELLARH